MLRPSLLIALTAFALDASIVQAQLPNVRRKVRDAGRQAVTGQEAQQRRPPPKFDNTILELNPQVVARLIKGLELRSTARGAGGLTIGELRRRASAAGDEAAQLYNDNSDDRVRWMDTNRTAETCMSDELDKMKEQRSQAMQQRMMSGANPADAMRFLEVSQEMQQAAAANDSAALQRAQDKMNKLLGFDPRADSAKARATCHVPPMPAWMRRADSLAARSDTLYRQARVAEDSAADAAARVAEMTPVQFAMAAERAEGFVVIQRSGFVGSGYVYTPIEEQALSARLADLRRHFG